MRASSRRRLLADVLDASAVELLGDEPQDLPVIVHLEINRLEPPKRSLWWRSLPRSAHRSSSDGRALLLVRE
jgi:hypothetical protein